MTPRTPLQRLAAYTSIRHDRRPAYVVPLSGKPIHLLPSDMDAILDHIRDLCSDHQSCAICGADLCETCGLGEFVDCDDGELHGACCWTECRFCLYESELSRRESEGREERL